MINETPDPFEAGQDLIWRIDRGLMTGEEAIAAMESNGEALRLACAAASTGEEVLETYLAVIGHTAATMMLAAQVNGDPDLIDAVDELMSSISMEFGAYDGAIALGRGEEAFEVLSGIRDRLERAIQVP